METNFERIVMSDVFLRFISLTQNITKDFVWNSLRHIENSSAAGIDEINIIQSKEQFTCEKFY